MPYLLLAWLALALGMIGIVVPGLPTTPFVLLAAWAAARGSSRLHDWLRAHRVFGAMIRDWQAGGAVHRRAKRAATATMALCAALLFATAPGLWMAAAGSAVMLIVGVWLWRRPEPPGRG
nr:YbaN family protein [Chiayiivirga flava]